ncbi:PREDICTED: GATA transcription factor 18-like [Nicotiana attenuata]|uniref:GATA transcription factor 18-like n=1 Tax=Nicotiana attenuata TaxID=49451 RepID=UPI000904A192|nr:PREDICTED: GATA transcription factor 18-like [Nicotiana attenuata]
MGPPLAVTVDTDEEEEEDDDGTYEVDGGTCKASEEKGFFMRYLRSLLLGYLRSFSSDSLLQQLLLFNMSLKSGLKKVQAVLLLLGECDIPTAVPTIEVPFDNMVEDFPKQCTKTSDSRGSAMMGKVSVHTTVPRPYLVGHYWVDVVVVDFPKQVNLSRRFASLVRFREKRKERCFGKKIRYSVRKEVAQRFLSVSMVSHAKILHILEAVVFIQTENEKDNNFDLNCPVKCHHCGVNENCTLAMRRGPDGPRTLRNACGLKWANKGTLRDLSKGARKISVEPKELGTPDNPMKAFAEGSLDQCADVEKNLFGTGSNHANEIPVGITSPSSNLVEQETLVDIGNASKTEIDIPANFDYDISFSREILPFQTNPVNLEWMQV